MNYSDRASVITTEGKQCIAKQASGNEISVCGVLLYKDNNGKIADLYNKETLDTVTFDYLFDNVSLFGTDISYSQNGDMIIANAGEINVNKTNYKDHYIEIDSTKYDNKIINTISISKNTLDITLTNTVEFDGFVVFAKSYKPSTEEIASSEIFDDPEDYALIIEYLPTNKIKITKNQSENISFQIKETLFINAESNLVTLEDEDDIPDVNLHLVDDSPNVLATNDDVLISTLSDDNDYEPPAQLTIVNDSDTPQMILGMADNNSINGVYFKQQADLFSINSTNENDSLFVNSKDIFLGDNTQNLALLNSNNDNIAKGENTVLLDSNSNHIESIENAAIINTNGISLRDINWDTLINNNADFNILTNSTIINTSGRSFNNTIKNTVMLNNFSNSSNTKSIIDSTMIGTNTNDSKVDTSGSISIGNTIGSSGNIFIGNFSTATIPTIDANYKNRICFGNSEARLTFAPNGTCDLYSNINNGASGNFTLTPLQVQIKYKNPNELEHDYKFAFGILEDYLKFCTNAQNCVNAISGYRETINEIKENVPTKTVYKMLTNSDDSLINSYNECKDLINGTIVTLFNPQSKKTIYAEITVNDNTIKKSYTIETNTVMQFMYLKNDTVNGFSKIM